MKNFFILKNLSRKIYFAGSGNFWYENESIGDDKSPGYNIYKAMLFSIYCFMTLLEILAALFGDFPEDEKRDSVTFAVSHTIVMIKIFSVIYNKELIKHLNKKIIDVCALYEEELLMREKYRIMKINVFAYFVAVWGATIFYIYEGIRKMLEGSNFVTIVTFWPPSNDSSMAAVTFRFITTLILCMLMITMLSIDCSAMIYLIMYKYKFITLRNYFENLRKEFEKNVLKHQSSAAVILTRGVVKGITMHEELLRLSKDIDKAFGTVMACQVCQSSGSAVSLLLQIALGDQLTFAAKMKTILFVVALFFLLALFLCNAGEITYQASLLSDAIFYCGWHACPPKRDLRKLVCVACARAQRPLVMKAFKMLELTYATFILVLRGTYSVFALFYAQNK